ncbi:hypothetical protein GNZ12_12545 [Paraburkholderia sp. 1N]|jgi:hypothetical protein|uniref:DNA-binding protein n=1 Tax=Paraburkholderia solitsugae TaxID=2675748 RepID=A0ABX2BQC9_9BURK|nr:hypothetical protein [Paraburkholderia solitsugae]NPT42131.1 hypothetical protein [Paraburkholderia solitsugae]
MGDFPSGQQLAESAQFVAPVPFMSRERFASVVGLPVGVIVGMINKGYLPTVDVGRYSCVNVALLMRRCGDASLKLSLWEL